MSVFVLISGLFVGRGVDKVGASAYLRSRVGGFLYLYILWTLIQGLIHFALSSVVNVPVSLTDVFAMWRPLGQLWFLPFLAIVTILAVLVRPWESASRVAVSIIVGLAVSLFFWGSLGSVVGPQGMSLAVFFVVGAVIGSERASRILARVAGLQVFFAAVIAVLGYSLMLYTPAVPPTSSGSHSDLSSRALGLGASVFGVLAVILISKLLELIPWAAKMLAFVGAHSLEIFVAHILAASGTRIILLKIGLDNIVLQVVAGTVFGVGLPLLLWWITKKLSFPYLFRAPRLITQGGHAGQHESPPEVAIGGTTPSLVDTPGN